MLGLLQVLSDGVEAFERIDSDLESNKMKLSTAAHICVAYSL